MSVILDFISMLRYFGLPVSPDETIIAQKTYSLLVREKESLFFGLRLAIVKRHDDLHIFNICFDRFFAPFTTISSPMSPQIPKQSVTATIDTNRAQDFLTRLEYSSRDIDREIGQFLLQNQIDQAIQTAQSFLGKGSGLLARFEEIQENIQRAFRGAFKIPVPIKGLTPNQRKELSPISLQMAANIQMFLQGLNRKLDLEKEEININREDTLVVNPENISQIEQFLNRDLNSLFMSVVDVKEQLIEIGKLLASREKRRRKQAKKGKLDFRRTFRKNLSNDGIPIELVQKKKKLHDPEIIVLNDISGSTRYVADFFFVITYAACEVFKKIRIMEFDNVMVEVTSALHKKTIKRALDERQAIWSNPKNLPRKRRIHSDYQTSFEDFFELIKYHPITRKTTVILLGDVRDHEGMWTSTNPISANLLRKIILKVKRVLILNPEDKSLWNTGDSVVKYYKNAGAEIYSVSTLNDLMNLAYNLR